MWMPRACQDRPKLCLMGWRFSGVPDSQKLRYQLLNSMLDQQLIGSAMCPRLISQDQLADQVNADFSVEVIDNLIV